MRMEQRKESWLQRQRPNGGKKTVRWPKLKGKQERTSCFFWIPLLLLLLSLWFLAFSLFLFFSVLCKNVRWMTLCNMTFMMKEDTRKLASWKNTKDCLSNKKHKDWVWFSSLPLYHLFTKSNFRKRYSNSIFRREIWSSNVLKIPSYQLVYLEHKQEFFSFFLNKKKKIKCRYNIYRFGSKCKPSKFAASVSAALQLFLLSSAPFGSSAKFPFCSSTSGWDTW